MRGHLRAQGIRVSESRVGAALRDVNEPYNVQRREVKLYSYSVCQNI